MTSEEDSPVAKRSFYDLQNENKVLRKEIDAKDQLIKQLVGMGPASTKDAKRDELIEKLEKKCAEYHARLHEQHDELHDKEARIIILEQENKLLKSELKELAEKTKSYASEIVVLREKREGSDSVRSKLEQEVASLSKQVDEKTDELKKLQLALADREEERASGKHAALASETASMKARIMELESLYDDAKGRLAEVEARVRKHPGAPDDVEAERRQLFDDRQKLAEEMRKFESEMKQRIMSSRQVDDEFEQFKHTLHAMLSVAYPNVKKTSDSIKEKVSWLLQNQSANSDGVELLKKKSKSKAKFDLDDFSESASESDSETQRSRRLHSRVNKDDERQRLTYKEEASLEERCRLLQRQFEKHCEERQEAERRCRKLEAEISEARARIHSLEHDIGDAHVMRDGLRGDKEKYLRTLEKLIHIMKLDKQSMDVGMDMLADAIIARAEQLARNENDAIANRSTQVHQLQRKLQQLKDQLESKDLHIELLRKKVGKVEERAYGKLDVERERDSETAHAKRAQTHLKKSKELLEETRKENVQLKAELLEASTLRLASIGSEKKIAELESMIEKLERVRQKQAQKIAELKKVGDDQVVDIRDTRQVSENVVQALSNEVRLLKQSLEDTRRREKHLVEFRAVVARLLGLDIRTLPVPDVDIMNRLERLVGAHQANTYTAQHVESMVDELQSEAREGYRDAQRLLGRQQRSVRGFSASSRRSPSPSSLQRDPRKY